MEDDDLEMLRLVALKSIQTKKLQNKEKVGNAIKVVESISSVPSSNSPYFSPVNRTHAGSRIQTLVNSNDNLIINDPYVPRHDAPWVETEYGAPYNNRKDDRGRKYAASVVPKVMDDKKRDDKLMFKSTFQVLPSEMKKSEAVKSTSKPTISSRVSPIKEKTGEKKLILLKRPADSTAEGEVEEGLKSSLL
ncbi:hypothetical protein Bhyg_01030 [Pseudolycoriella hygida]|uniref:Uncharacterized protein n=1 Tax=Pseudolycoriella hygida TaxID=35572 RepID=A0A9Q0N8L1_9DIPT|nr:hypothetical protein Bhyg_01030 [Pseudolycoriella hygida]